MSDKIKWGIISTGHISDEFDCTAGLNNGLIWWIIPRISYDNFEIFSKI